MRWLPALLCLGLALAQAPEVWLTGAPVPSSFVEQAARRGLEWAGLGASLPQQSSLGFGERREVPLGTATLYLTQAPYPPHRTTQLLLSNDPESIPATRGLFHYRFANGEGMRLIYHHKNTSEGLLNLEVRIFNPSPETVWIWVSDAMAGPVPDEVYAGHVATKRWLELYWNQVGQLVELPPNSERSLSRLALRPGTVVSGILEAVVTRGSAAVLDMVAKAPQEADPPLETYQQGRVYRLDTLETRVQKTHIAGGSTFLTLGDGAFKASDGKQIAGNWGMFYTYDLELQNPTPTPQTVGFQVIAAGGIARGVIWLEGQVYELPLLRPGQTYDLPPRTVPPGARQRVTLSTLPASGSNYPLRLLLYNPLATAGQGSP
jgi:hypothetical protein